MECAKSTRPLSGLSDRWVLHCIAAFTAVTSGLRKSISCLGLVQSDLARPSGAPSRLDVQHEQDFFRAHYEILARESTKHQTQNLQNQSAQQQQQQGGPSRPAHSRNLSALSPPLGDGSEAVSQAQRYFGSGGSAGVVGPLASGGLSLPSVEKVLQRDSAQNGLEASANIAATGAPNVARSAGVSRRVSDARNEGKHVRDGTDLRLIGLRRIRPVRAALLLTASPRLLCPSRHRQRRHPRQGRPRSRRTRFSQTFSRASSMHEATGAGRRSQRRLRRPARRPELNRSSAATAGQAGDLICGWA